MNQKELLGYLILVLFLLYFCLEDLKIEDLHVNIEDKEILKGVNLEVKKGEVHAIMGPNGSGKSTLSSVIAGNEDYEVTKGNIYFNNENIEDLSPEERAHKGIFMSFQYPVEIPGVSVTNFIKTAINSNLKAKGLKEMPANEMLKKIREKCIEQGALLIYDEIQSCYGRTGKLFALEHNNIIPDILCIAKGMGGGIGAQI